MNCLTCGLELTETDDFCPSCNAPNLPQSNCPDCGALVREDWNFCQVCSVPLTTDGVVDANFSDAKWASLNSEHCPHCGCVVGKDFTFCDTCGKRLRFPVLPAAVIDFECPKCGTRYPVNAPNCPNCGATNGYNPVLPDEPEVGGPEEPKEMEPFGENELEYGPDLGVFY